MLWSNEEITKLIEVYPDKTDKEISSILGRTLKSISKKASSLGLKKSKTHISNNISRRNKIVGRDLNYNELKKIAYNFKSKSEFQKNDPSAYYTARVNGYLEDICSHMTKFAFSIPQMILKKIIESTITTEIKYNDRKTIHPYEIDIFIPKYNIAFEYNGKRWHTNNKNDIIKNEILNKSGIKLFKIEEKSRDYDNDVKEQFIKIIPEINRYTNLYISKSTVVNIDTSDVYDKIIDKKDIFKICNKYDKYTDFRKNEQTIYNYLLRSNKLSEYTSHMIKKIRWDDEKAIEVLKNVNSLYDLIKNKYGCYLWIKKNSKEYLLKYINNLIYNSK